MLFHIWWIFLLINIHTSLRRLSGDDGGIPCRRNDEEFAEREKRFARRKSRRNIFHPISIGTYTLKVSPTESNERRRQFPKVSQTSAMNISQHLWFLLPWPLFLTPSLPHSLPLSILFINSTFFFQMLFYSIFPRSPPFPLEPAPNAINLLRIYAHVFDLLDLFMNNFI